MNSEKHLYHCIDLMNADPNISEATRIIMFVEYGKKLLAEVNSGWVKYPDIKPVKPGRFEVYRKSVKKQHFEVWNGEYWSYNENEITHYREIIAPL